MPASRPKPRIAVVLMNLGTPDEPTPAGVRRFLREFLSDPRVIEIPKLLWWVILNLFVLTFRPKRVAKAYASIWGDGDSPMRLIVQKQTELLQQTLQPLYPHANVTVHAAMTYGNPATAMVLDDLKKQQIEHVVILPLFPQYSSTSTGAAFDVVNKWLSKRRDLISMVIIKDYYQHPLYIAALAERVRQYQREHGMTEKLLMSFHGIPQPYADKGDPYPQQCRVTASLLAQALELNDDQWAISFQSRFGKQEWIKPYTDVLLERWGKEGVNSIQVISPAFSADCLETLEELAIENRELFLHAGGQAYSYIPALNTDELHIELFTALTAPLINGFLASSFPDVDA